MVRKNYKYLTQEDVHAHILEGIERRRSELSNPERAHAFVFLGFYLGLRISEACLLKPEHFDLRDRIARIPTLKQGTKIPHECPYCGRHFKLSGKRSGKKYTCSNCGKVSPIKKVADGKIESVPLIALPPIEDAVWEYLEEYIGNMPKDQKYLLEHNGHQCDRHDLATEFKRSLFLGGLPSAYKPHALRHGRGQQLYTLTNDLKAVQAYLRHQSANTASIYAHMKNIDEYAKRLNEAAWSRSTA